MTSEHPFLSKSLVLKGLQCDKALWLTKNRPELRVKMHSNREVLLSMGREIGRLARDVFPGGVLVSYRENGIALMAEETKALIASGAETIYEATFVADNVVVMVDILQKTPEGYVLYEVKSSTGNRGYDYDIAVQYHVIRKAGIDLVQTFLLHIDNNYVRRGEIEPKRLFKAIDLTEQVVSLQPLVEESIENSRKVVAGKMPERQIGVHCKSPYDCDFLSLCWDHIPDYSIFDISGLRMSDKFRLYDHGFLHLDDFSSASQNEKKLPPCRIGEHQWLQIVTELSGEPVLKPEEIKRFLKRLTYPLYFLDFETFQMAVPPFDNLRSFQQIPFQFSLHWITQECSSSDEEKYLFHKEFLAPEGEDPRELLAQELCASIPDDVCILAYNMSFEKGIVKILMNQFPHMKGKLQKIHDNIHDLMVPFKKKHYYQKEMKGSCSIKYVLPALVPNLDYKTMNIKNGDEARIAYSTLHLIEDRAEREIIKKDLLDYCRLDTYAMVKLLQKLQEITASDPLSSP